MRDHRILGGVAQRGDVEQAEMIPELAGQLGLGDRLSGGAANPRDADQRSLVVVFAIGARQLLRGEGEDGFEQAVPGIANRELRRVDPHGEAADPGRGVVPDQPALAALVEPPRGRQGQRHRGYRNAAIEARIGSTSAYSSKQRLRVESLGVQNRPSLASKWVGLPSVGPRRVSQSATHRIN